jgi:hypothetical protein
MRALTMDELEFVSGGDVRGGSGPNGSKLLDSKSTQVEGGIETKSWDESGNVLTITFYPGGKGFGGDNLYEDPSSGRFYTGDGRSFMSEAAYRDAERGRDAMALAASMGGGAATGMGLGAAFGPPGMVAGALLGAGIGGIGSVFIPDPFNPYN